MRLRDGFSWHRLALAAIVLLALALRYEGVQRPLTMHPDEPKINVWMRSVREPGWLKDETYPGGFFVMAEASRRLWERLVFRPWQGFLVHSGEIGRPVTDLSPASFGRHFTVWLGSLTVILVSMLCRRVSGSRAGGLFGAALFALSAYHIEHSHYLESDVAMVATLALALWLLARHADTPRPGCFAAAALATGYAAGTKYTLVLLVPSVLVFALARPAGASPGSGGRAWRGKALWVLVGIALVVAGFLLATRQALDFMEYLAELRKHGASVYAETQGVLGRDFAAPWARPLHHLRELRHAVADLGAGWLLAAAAGLPLLLTRGRRRFWPVTVLFPALFLFYYLFEAPFVRSQEFLNLLPAFSAAAASAAAWMVDRGGQRGVTRVLTALLLAALLVPTARLGTAAASRCGWEDTRLLAQSWFFRQMPREETVVVEKYVPPATRDLREIGIWKMEKAGLPALLADGASFLVRNPGYFGRGLVDPRSGGWYSEFQANAAAFAAGAERLRVWSAIEPQRPRVSFRSPTLELWSLRATARGPALELALPQPLVLGEGGHESFFPIGHLLGAADAVVIDQHGRDLAVGGPEEPEGPVYVVLSTDERPAKVHLRGFGRRRAVELQPFDAVAVPLERPWWAPRFGAYERLRAWTDRRKNETRVLCLLRIAFDEAEAARLLAELGRPESAAALLAQHGGGRDRGLAFRLAVVSGRVAEAAAMEPAAAAENGEVEKVLRGETPSWRLNGASAWHYDDLSRARLTPRDQSESLELREPDDGGRERPPLPLEAWRLVPVRLAGPASLRLEARWRPAGDEECADTQLELRDGTGRVLHAGPWPELCGGGFAPLEFDVSAGPRERPLALRWNSSSPGNVEIRNLEIRWNLAQRLSARIREFKIARARLQAERGELHEARATRAGLPLAGPDGPDVDLRRLDFELASAAGDVAAAARRLLESAPAHFAALRALAGSDLQAAAEAARLGGGAGGPAEFGGLLAVRRAEIAEGRLRLVVEALRDDTPALAVQVRERGLRRWAKRGRASVSPGRPLHAGERAVVELPLGGRGDSRLGVSVITDVPFAPGELLANGTPVVEVADLPHAATAAGGQ